MWSRNSDTKVFREILTITLSKFSPETIAQDPREILLEVHWRILPALSGSSLPKFSEGISYGNSTEICFATVSRRSNKDYFQRFPRFFSRKFFCLFWKFFTNVYIGYFNTSLRNNYWSRPELTTIVFFIKSCWEIPAGVPARKKKSEKKSKKANPLATLEMFFFFEEK